MCMNILYLTLAEHLTTCPKMSILPTDRCSGARKGVYLPPVQQGSAVLILRASANHEAPLGASTFVAGPSSGYDLGRSEARLAGPSPPSPENVLFPCVTLVIQVLDDPDHAHMRSQSRGAACLVLDGAI